MVINQVSYSFSSRAVSYTLQAIRRYSQSLTKHGLCKMLKNPDKGKELLWSKTMSQGNFLTTKNAVWLREHI